VECGGKRSATPLWISADPNARAGLRGKRCRRYAPPADSKTPAHLHLRPLSLAPGLQPGVQTRPGSENCFQQFSVPRSEPGSWSRCTILSGAGPLTSELQTEARVPRPLRGKPLGHVVLILNNACRLCLGAVAENSWCLEWSMAVATAIESSPVMKPVEQPAHQRRRA
jgi:hypothetical protein